MTKFTTAQAATLSTRDAKRDMARTARQANIIAEINPDPYSHDEQLAKLLRSGYHIETQTDELTQLAKGHPVNHILHLLLSVFTFGLWLPVWLLVALVSGEKRKVVARSA